MGIALLAGRNIHEQDNITKAIVNEEFVFQHGWDLESAIGKHFWQNGEWREVVGVVNMDGYIARVEEENRLKELAKKKAAIEKELEAEINKRKSVEYYEEMAKKYSDNPKLAELVAELKGLGE